MRAKIPFASVAAGVLLAAGAISGAQAQGQTAPQQAQQQPKAQPQGQAQQQHGAQQQAGQPGRQVAQKCLDDLQALNRQMADDGYWLTGWGARWGTPPQTGVTTGAPATTRAPTTSGAAATSPRTEAAAPWGTGQRFGIQSPRYQIRVLHDAANVLAHRGDQEACANVVSELRNLYETHVAELRQAGVEPGAVTTWRQERIVAAQPVQQLRTPVSIDNVTGTELRNAKDQRLGSVHDVIVDPKSGQISHVLVARGGFFGIGADFVAVPWQYLRATPNLNLFVLNVPEQVMEQSPGLDRGQLDDWNLIQRHRQDADQYWKQHTAG